LKNRKQFYFFANHNKKSNFALCLFNLNNNMTLYDLNQGEKGIIIKLMGRGAFRRRLMEMGFVTGQTVTVIKKAPLKDPVEYNVMGYNVSIRNEEAKHIEITLPENYKDVIENFNGNSTFTTEKFEKEKLLNEKEINIVLVGNPNAGKTTLFNYVSGAHERVGNYSGVTISAKEGTFKHKDFQLNIVDLPGTYSITAFTPEEVFVRNYIIDNHPDVVVNVVDASNLERNLYLTTQLIDLDIKVVVALNMYDELLNKNDNLNYNILGELLGIPMIPTVSSKNTGIEELFDTIIEVYKDNDPVTRHIHINYGEFVENAIKKIKEKIVKDENFDLVNHISSRFTAIKLLEKDREIYSKIETCFNKDEILETTAKERNKLEKLYNNITSQEIITNAKYGFIAGALKETFKKGNSKRKSIAELFDWLFTNRFLGFPIFIFFMWLMFTLTFKLGSYPMQWIENAFKLLSTTLSSILPEGALTSLLVDGIIHGVGGVIVFLPNILLLFFFISLMEDTGYMARAVFIMDKIMHKIGLHGKSFIPLVMGFGCNVPAILATRTIENKNERLLTMLINPFMSCSARLPVYVLLISAFFPDNRGNILFGIYCFGILTAVVISVLFKKIFFRKNNVPFVMELPPFRVPTSRSIIRGMWGKGIEYLKKIAGIVLIATVIIWGLSNYPVNKSLVTDFENLKAQTVKEYEFKMASADKPSHIFLEKEKFKALNTIDLQKKAALQEYSLLGRIGHFILPVIRPLGFDWKMGVAVISGAPAKEIIVGTMGVLYQSDEQIDNNVSLIAKIQQQKYTDGKLKGQHVFSPVVAFSFMIFVLLYFPCIGTLVVIARESGSWKWAFFTATYTTALAWLVSFAIFQIGSLF